PASRTGQGSGARQTRGAGRLPEGPAEPGEIGGPDHAVAIAVERRGVARAPDFRAERLRQPDPVGLADDAVVVVVGVAAVPVAVVVGVDLVGIRRADAVVHAVGNAVPVPICSVALESRVQPILARQVVLDAGDVLLRGPIPVAREPSADTAPHVSRAIAIAQPDFLPLVAATPDGVGIV